MPAVAGALRPGGATLFDVVGLGACKLEDFRLLLAVDARVPPDPLWDWESWYAALGPASARHPPHVADTSAISRSGKASARLQHRAGLMAGAIVAEAHAAR